MRRFLFLLKAVRTVNAWVCLFLALAVGLSSLAGEALRLTLDRADGLYGTGETATVTIELAPEWTDRSWEGVVTWQSDFTGPEETVTYTPTAEPFVFTLAENGVRQVMVSAALREPGAEASAHRASVGLLFRPTEMEISTLEPEDFDLFWNRQKQEWRALPHRIELRPVPSPRAGVGSWDLTIHIEGKTPARGYLAKPLGAATESLPAILLLHGAGVRSSNLNEAARHAEMGFLALDLNAHGIPNGESPEFYQDLAANALRDYSRAGLENRETWYLREMILRLLSATDFLCNQPEWNGRDLILRGSSKGGAQAMAGAGLDPRVTAVAASVPALCDLSAEKVGRKSGWPQPLTRHPGEEGRALAAETVRYYEVGHFARRTQAALIVSLGLIDAVCPAHGIQAATNAWGGPTELLYRPAMAHAIPGEINAAFDEFILNQVGKRRP